jgi:hypothetical protein
MPILFILFALLSGCIHAPIAITASTKPLSQDGYTVLGSTHGQDCVYHLFAAIPLSDGNELHEAVADAMKKKPYADALIDVTVDYYFQWWILFTRACTQVHGVAVQSK